MTRGALRPLVADLTPGAAVVAVTLLVALAAVAHTEVATGLHPHLHHPPPAALGQHHAAAGPAHTLAVTETPPGAAAGTTVDTVEGIAVNLLRATTGHTLAPTANPLTGGTTDPDLDHQATAAGTAKRANTGLLSGLLEAGQGPDLQNALLPLA